MSTIPTSEPAPPRNTLGEVEPPIPDPDAGTREGEPDPDTLDQTPPPPPPLGDRDLAPGPDQVLARAASFLGYKERGDNDTTFGAWYGLNHQPWCDMFVSYVFAQEGAGAIGGRFAYCPSHVTWFRQRGQWGTTPRRGAVVFFSWDGGPTADHVGIVEVPSASPQTIEGNTCSGAAGSQGNGDGVYRRIRNPKFVLGYGYPAYGGPGGAVASASVLAAAQAGPAAPAGPPVQAGRPTPVVSLSHVVAAARADGPRPQGQGTPGSVDDVLVVERALHAEGLLDAGLVDGSFGTSSVAGYRRWQQRLGFAGRDADGIPGMDSLRRLGAAHGFSVTG